MNHLKNLTEVETEIKNSIINDKKKELQKMKSQNCLHASLKIYLVISVH